MSEVEQEQRSVAASPAEARPVGEWAGRRLLDTALGCAIALVATYLLWPRDHSAEAESTVLVAT